VLVLTLAVLVLAATALASAGRLAVRHAARARDAERDLRRRVGVASCRAAVLPRAEQILVAQEVRRGAPVAQHRAAVRLGEFTFDLVIADEHAKASVNAILATAPRDVVETRLRRALAGSGLPGAVVLRPVPSSTDERVHVVSAFGQVFNEVEPQALLSSRGGVPAPTDLLTCWGGGAINVRRASEAALRLALSPPWTSADVARLLEARRAMFEAKTSDSSNLRPSPARPAPGAARRRDPLARLLQDAQIRTGGAGLTLESACHSLWIVTRDGRRQWYDLAVADAPKDQPRRVITFTW
jgi:hypothetical protein